MSFPPLATTADLTTYLNGRQLSDAQTALAQLLLNAVSEVIRGRDVTGQILSRATTTVELLVDPSEPWITLPQQPVVSVAAVKVGDQPVIDSDYRRVGGRLFRYCGWYSASTTTTVVPRIDPPTVEVTYTHGYDPVPADVVTAACMWVDTAMGGSVPVRSKQIGDYSVSYADVVPGTGLGLTLDALKARYRQGQASTVAVGHSWR